MTTMTAIRTMARWTVATFALVTAILLTTFALDAGSVWATVVAGLGVWVAAATAVQLVASAARSAARAAARETDEALLRRYVAYRDELDRADGRAES